MESGYDEHYVVTGIDDVERTDFMFSDFPADRNINPKHWESKIIFWKGEIVKSCKFYHDFCVNCEKLKSRFHDKDGRSPKGMMTVIGYMYQDNELHMRSSYIDLMDDTWGRWTYNIAKKSSLWLWRKAWGYNEQTMFVVRQLIEESAQNLLDKHYKTVKYENTDNIVPWNVIKTLYKINGKPLSEDDLVCIIGYLKSKGKCRIGISASGDRIVKFKGKEQNRVDLIQPVDFDIVKLRKAIAKLQLECSQIEKETQKLQENVKELVKMKNKEKAKRILAQKNKISKGLQLKQNALFGMKEQLRMVQDSESTKMIADTFSASADMLNMSYKQQGLTVENIEDVMDKTLDAKQMVNEIDEALSSGLGRLDDDMDIDELEKELESLTTEEISDIELPDVPTTLPPNSIISEEKIPKKQKDLVPAS